MIWPKGIVFSVRLLDRDQPGARVGDYVVEHTPMVWWSDESAHAGARVTERLGERLITAVVRTKDIAPTVRR
jgi:hypothetical protein